MMTEAAELQAAGTSWAEVAEQVQRSAETCRQWPRLYPELWRRPRPGIARRLRLCQ
jgi:hypothetical protein